MPRFFRQAGDSASSDESDEDLLASEEDEQEVKPTTKPIMSRFLRKAGGRSSSSSSSEDEDEDESDASEAEVKKKPTRNNMASDAEDEESDEGLKRVPLRATDKRMQQMETIGAAMENAQKINDWVVISTGTSHRP